MDITRVTGNEIPSVEAKKKDINQPKITQFEMNESRKTMNPLMYYQNMVKEFPDISFRLSDKAALRPGVPNFGYNGSMNQIGENFAEPGQVSVTIDVAVIRKMQVDQDFESKILSGIRVARYNYETVAAECASDGMPYFCFLFDDHHVTTGSFSAAQIMSPNHFSTEEEVREIWAESEESEEKKLFYRYFNHTKDELLETFMKMVADGNQRIKEDMREKAE